MQRIFRNANAVHAFTQEAKRSRSLTQEALLPHECKLPRAEACSGHIPFTEAVSTSVGGDLESQTLIDAPELLAERVHLALDSRCGGGRREHARNRRYRSHGMKVSEASTEALACYPFCLLHRD